MNTSEPFVVDPAKKPFYNLLQKAEAWVDKHGFSHNCDARLASFALSLFQWKDVADGLPEVSGFYVVELRSKLHELDGTAIAAAKFEVGKSLWMNVRAYIPYPIPPYKQQSNEQN